jgi:DNA polymerase-3 subunit epsilon
MKGLALQERFEEAAAIRDRMSAFVRGCARGQRIRSLTKVPELIAARPQGASWAIILIRFGRLAASITTEEARFEGAIDALLKAGEVIVADGSILPASSHEEVEVLLRYLSDDQVRILHLVGEWSSPIFGAGYARSILEGARTDAQERSYKEEFANSFDSSAHR